MTSCYRSMPRYVGEVLDGASQHPLLIILIGLAIVSVGAIWHRFRNAQ